MKKKWSNLKWWRQASSQNTIDTFITRQLRTIRMTLLCMGNTSTCKCTDTVIAVNEIGNQLCNSISDLNFSFLLFSILLINHFLYNDSVTLQVWTNHYMYSKYNRTMKYGHQWFMATVGVRVPYFQANHCSINFVKYVERWIPRREIITAQYCEVSDLDTSNKSFLNLTYATIDVWNRGILLLYQCLPRVVE